LSAPALKTASRTRRAGPVILSQSVAHITDRSKHQGNQQPSPGKGTALLGSSRLIWGRSSQVVSVCHCLRYLIHKTIESLLNEEISKNGCKNSGCGAAKPLGTGRRSSPEGPCSVEAGGVLPPLEPVQCTKPRACRHAGPAPARRVRASRNAARKPFGNHHEFLGLSSRCLTCAEPPVPCGSGDPGGGRSSAEASPLRGTRCSTLGFSECDKGRTQLLIRWSIR